MAKRKVNIVIPVSYDTDETTPFDISAALGNSTAWEVLDWVLFHLGEKTLRCDSIRVEEQK